MNLSQIFWGVGGILFGVAFLGIAQVPGWALGLVFLVAGILTLIEGFTQPVTIRTRRFRQD